MTPAGKARSAPNRSQTERACGSDVSQGRDDALEASRAGKSWADLRQGAGAAAVQQPSAPDSCLLSARQGHEASILCRLERGLPQIRAYLIRIACVLRRLHPVPVDAAQERGRDLGSVPVAVRAGPRSWRSTLEAALNNPAWVQHAKNQQLLLDTFFSAVETGPQPLFSSTPRSRRSLTIRGGS